MWYFIRKNIKWIKINLKSYGTTCFSGFTITGNIGVYKVWTAPNKVCLDD